MLGWGAQWGGVPFSRPHQQHMLVGGCAAVPGTALMGGPVYLAAA
jgi:hypothetical protein